MKLSELKLDEVKQLNSVSLEREVMSCYIGDLLSFVMANGKEGCLWLTVQKHLNVIAVAELNDFAGIIFVQGVEVDKDTIVKAAELDIPLFSSSLTAYDLAKELMIRGL